MQISNVLSMAATISVAAAQYKGFNYASTFTDGSAKSQSDFEAEFAAAKALAGTSGFTSARLYTSIQSGTDSTPISAIPAAIAQDTSLLLGLWASGGDAGYTNEINAILSAISTYGTDFTSRVVGISVGSEDLYRTSTIGIASLAGVGTSPDVIVKYITQLKTALASTTLSSAKITHVDTYNAWTNSSNAAVISAVDFLSMDVYPYFQKEMANSIDMGSSLFNTALEETVAVAQGKDVWVTETGWPVSGDTVGAAVASVANAKTYWDEVGCNTLFGKVNTYWYILQDALPTLPSPSFGLVGAGSVSQSPLFNLTCPASVVSSASASASASQVASAQSSSSTGAAKVGAVAAEASSASAVQSSGRPVFSTATTSAATMSSHAVSAAGAVVTSAAHSSGTGNVATSARTTARSSTTGAGSGVAAAQTSAAASNSVAISTSAATNINVLPVASAFLCMVAMFMTI